MKYNFIPNNPFYMCKSVKKVPCCNFFALYAKCFFINISFYIPPRIPRIIPPIITEPICPETLALTACIKIKF